MAIRNQIRTSSLPAATKQFLFHLVVGGGAQATLSEVFTQNPDGIAGRTTKFGAAAGLAPGAATAANQQGATPGRFRLIRHIHNARPITVWFYAEHMGRSSYNFDKIIFPACESCQGTTEMLCPQCQGTNMLSQGTQHPHPLVRHRIMPNRMQCTSCNGKRVIHCTT